MDQAYAVSLALVPTVLLLVEILKKVELTPRRWVPLVALTTGVVLSVLVAWSGEVAELDTSNWGRVILVGLLGGAGASGVHSQLSTLADGDA